MKCERCDKEYTPNPYARNRTKYCSLKCQRQAIEQRARESGRRTILARQDYERHKEQYKLRAKTHREKIRFDGLRECVLKRDNYECIKCGSKNDLEVHHRDGRGRRKEIPNNHPDNLQTLCAKCHCIQTQKDCGRLVEVTKETMFDAIEKTTTFKKAAKYLGMPYITFEYKKKQLGIDGDKLKVCPICSKVFIATSAFHYKVYCSQNCKREGDKRNQKEKRIVADENRILQKRNCIVCGKEFEVGKFTPKKQTCSPKCGARYERIKRAERNKLKKAK